MEIFETCSIINDHLTNRNDVSARAELIKLLDFHAQNEIAYSPLVNHLIRATGLYPYLQVETANWQDRFVYEAFKVDIGKGTATLHREQSSLLKKLLDGESIAVSAPTSFGKSFVIDAFIALKKPKNVVIIVPTIALTDETRRRIYKKFANTYKIITTTDVELSDQNIFIFPQERAVNYVNRIESIDILIIDEFYKASVRFDKERAPTLVKAMLELGRKAKQKYFLAPNISTLKENPFTEGMEFIPVNFSTVFTEKQDLYKTLNDIDSKSKKLIEILHAKKTKTLIYAGTYSNINYLSNLLEKEFNILEIDLLANFSAWLKLNYSDQYLLADLVHKGIGIHNGRLHRSLSQIQIKLFEEENGLETIISTSSIIEGINTSTENVVIWSNRNGNPLLNDFTYKNIIGRGGRMFKHFIGKIFIFEEPPVQEQTQLDIEFSDANIGSIDEVTFKKELTREQIVKIIAYKEEMSNLLGKDTWTRLSKEETFQSNASIIKDLATDMIEKPSTWNSLPLLNSFDVNKWDNILYKALNFSGGVGVQYRSFVSFIKILSENWVKSIPQILTRLKTHNIELDLFFELEKNATFKLTSLLSDINILQREIFKNKSIDISPFVSKLSHAFLPSVVFQLEEYGLPRVLAKRIHNAGYINFVDPNLTLHQAILMFDKIGKDQLKKNLPELHVFEEYILDYFYDGITIK